MKQRAKELANQVMWSGFEQEATKLVLEDFREIERLTWLAASKAVREYPGPGGYAPEPRQKILADMLAARAASLN